MRVRHGYWINIIRILTISQSELGSLLTVLNPTRSYKTLMGCACSKIPAYEEPVVLATETHFTVKEVEALFELFTKISSSINNDGVIQKEEFQLAIFKDRTKRNIFSDRIFDMFDTKRSGVIDFGEFVRSLSVFHPSAPIPEKIAFLYHLYDVRQTGYIEKEELNEMILALLHESELMLPDDIVELIVNQTFTDADTKGDGKIDPEEWKNYVSKNPSIIKNMTLPDLKDINMSFPSFAMGSEFGYSELH